MLEYSEFRHFLPVIEKAKEACLKSDHRVEDHFEQILEMVGIGSGAQRGIEDWKFSRYASYFCPYHNDAEWVRLKNDEPEEFQKAVRFEIDFQISVARTPMTGVPYLHRSMKPLSEVDFSTEEQRGQQSLNLFNNECEGMCGV